MQEWSQEDLTEKIDTEGPVCLYLYTPLCGTCQVAGKMLSVVEKLLPHLSWGKCNLNYIPKYANEWEIESVPCLIIFKNSQINKKIYAFHSVPFLYETIQEETDSQ